MGKYRATRIAVAERLLAVASREDGATRRDWTGAGLCRPPHNRPRCIQGRRRPNIRKSTFGSATVAEHKPK